MTSRRILHVFGVMDRGGAELRTVDLMPHLPRHLEQHFCVLGGRRGALDAHIQNLGGKIHYCRLDSGFIYRFHSLLQQERIDVVHSHVHLFSGPILALAKLSGVERRIAHFRSSGDGHPSSYRRIAQRALNRNLVKLFATDVVAVSATTMRHVMGEKWHRDSNYGVLYSGIDPEPYRRAKPELTMHELGLQGGPVVVQIGRFSPPKNHAHTIRVFADLLDSLPSALLVLAGRGGNDIERETRKAVSDLGIADRVRFVGERSDIPNVLAAADVMLLPSLWEGLPGVVLEAAASGLPVVASTLDVFEEIRGHLPSLQTVPLEAPIAEWSAAVRCAVSSSSEESRVRARNAFSSGPFDVHSSAARIASLWAR